jgi:hypothetical protein
MGLGRKGKSGGRKGRSGRDAQKTAQAVRQPDGTSQTMTYGGFRHLENGRTSMNDKQCGWLSTSRSKALIAQVKSIIDGIRWLSEKFAEEVGISIGSCRTVLTEDLGMYWVSAEFVQRLLTGDQKLQQFSICENLLQMSLLVMRPGCTVTLKPNNNPRNGRVLLSPPQESMTRVLASESFIWQFWDIYEWGTKKVTWNVDCGKLACPLW